MTRVTTKGHYCNRLAACGEVILFEGGLCSISFHEYYLRLGRHRVSICVNTMTITCCVVCRGSKALCALIVKFLERW